jgi:regulator of protease activity HflC (stomatin/prohibitin superfamily)
VIDLIYSEEYMNIASVIQGLGSFGLLAFVGLIALAVMRASRRQPTKGLVGVMAVVGIASVLLTVVGAGLVFVQPDERGVVITIREGGVRQVALEPGLHWVVPFVEWVQPYSISRQSYTMSIAPNEGDLTGDDSIRARTKDGQEVTVDASVIYAIDPTKVVSMHINWQNRYENELVRPAARNTIRDAVSQYSIEEVVSTKRAEMEQLISTELGKALADNDLVLLGFLLRDIHFSDEYAAAVEQKQIAEQQAQQAKFVVESKKQEAEQARQVAQGQADAAVIKAKGEAEARIIQAEAEAKANDLLAASLSGHPELLTWLYINKLAPNVQVMFLPSNSPFVFPLPDVITQ